MPNELVASRFNVAPKAANLKPDPVIQSNIEYKGMLVGNPSLVNAGIGEIRDPDLADDHPHEPWVPHVIRQQMQLRENTSYQPPTGELPISILLATRFILGAQLTERLYGGDITPYVFTCLTAGGTHAKYLGSRFLAENLPLNLRQAYYDSGWPGTPSIYTETSIDHHTYQRSAEVGWYDHNRWADGHHTMPDGSIDDHQLDQHNDDGKGRTTAEWIDVLERDQKKNMVVFFDTPYQTQGHGLEKDVWPVRQAIKNGLTVVVAGSMSKLGGQYGKRDGGYLAIFNSGENPDDIRKQITSWVRPTISSPPHARHLRAPLEEEVKFERWMSELDEIRLMNNQKRTIMNKALGGLFRANLDTQGMYYVIPGQLQPEQRMAIIEATNIFIPESNVKGTRVNLGGIPLGMMDNFASEVATNL